MCPHLAPRFSRHASTSHRRILKGIEGARRRCMFQVGQFPSLSSKPSNRSEGSYHFLPPIRHLCHSQWSLRQSLLAKAGFFLVTPAAVPPRSFLPSAPTPVTRTLRPPN